MLEKQKSSRFFKDNISAIFIFALFAAAVIFPIQIRATNFSSSNFSVTNPVISAGGDSSSSTNFGLGQSVDQIAIGKSTSANFQLWSGFQYFFKVNPNVLSATAGVEQVTLNWTVPQTFLGVSVTSYEVGVGTVSGSYTFQDVGNVTSFVQTGLVGATQYFFIIKAKSGNSILVFSNQATATPTAAGNTGGNPTPSVNVGGAGQENSKIILSGQAAPASQIIVLLDGQVAAMTTADSNAEFNLTLNNLLPGNYNLSIYSKDQNGNKSSSQSFYRALASKVATSITGIFLSPTIAVSNIEIKKGADLTFSGYTVPGAEINILIDAGKQIVKKIIAGSDGAWFNQFDTSILDFGDHNAAAQAKKNDLFSPYSDAVSFKVSDKNIVKSGCTLSADINCDGKVDLADLSILLYYYGDNFSYYPRADINSDGTIGLADISILLYQWTG